MSKNLRVALATALAFGVMSGAAAQSSQTGQSGLIHMPDGRVAPDGELRFGGSHMAPYTALWGSLALLPWLEVSGRYTRVADIPVFTDDQFTGRFGNYKDKAFDVKIRLFEETDTLPAVAVGYQDFHGTGIFPGWYAAASKRFGAFDVTLGVGGERFDGPFGGVRWTTPWLDERVRLVLEWDGYDYTDDFYARRTGNIVREGGLTAGVEYDGGWWHAQLSRQESSLGMTLSMMLPLQQPTFIPKTQEPPPVTIEIAERPTLAQWHDEPATLAPMFEALVAEGFRDVRARIDGDTVHLSVEHGRMTMIGRVAGRVSRVVALHAPEGVRSLHLTVTEAQLPLATYRFTDLELLRGFFEGTVPPDAMHATLSTSYASADAWATLRDDGLRRHDIETDEPATRRPHAQLSAVSVLAPITLYGGSGRTGTLRVQPFRVGVLFNDPNDVVLYELFSTLSYTQWFGDTGFYFNSSGRLMLVENISDTAVPSNSLLPRVRSDINLYRQGGGRFTLVSAYLGHIWNPMDRVYTSAVAGIVEEMFAGVGGEVLYLPERGNWAVDFSAYGVKQRDFEGYFGFQDYQTVTALAAFHYRIPQHGVTLTTRVGRFLAGDVGARFEMKRRFRSGFEAGAWYTHTDAQDITSPGRPGDPYRDKGIFIRFALGPFMPQDNAASVNMALSPWTRDPGQMLYAPGNLYSMYERRLLLNLREYGPWTDFGY